MSERIPVTSLPENVRIAIKRTAPFIKTVVLDEIDVPVAVLKPVPTKYEPLKNGNIRDAVSVGNGGRVEANRDRLVGQWPGYDTLEGSPINLDPSLGPWFIIDYYVKDYGPAQVTSVHVLAQRGTVNKALFPAQGDASRVQLTKLAAHLLYLQHHYNSRGRPAAIMAVRQKYNLDESSPLNQSRWVRIAMDELMEKGLAKYTKNMSILLTPQGTAVASRLPRWADPIYGYNQPAPDTYLAGF